MSGGLPPFTAVSTFCSVSSLLTYRVLTFCPGCCASYSETRCANSLASVSVEPSQIGIVREEEDPDGEGPPPFASEPQPAAASDVAVSAASTPTRAPRLFLALVMSHSARRCMHRSPIEQHCAGKPGQDARSCKKVVCMEQL